MRIEEQEKLWNFMVSKGGAGAQLEEALKEYATGVGCSVIEARNVWYKIRKKKISLGYRAPKFTKPSFFHYNFDVEHLYNYVRPLVGSKLEGKKKAARAIEEYQKKHAPEVSLYALQAAYSHMKKLRNNKMPNTPSAVKPVAVVPLSAVPPLPTAPPEETSDTTDDKVSPILQAITELAKSKGVPLDEHKKVLREKETLQKEVEELEKENTKLLSQLISVADIVADYARKKDGDDGTPPAIYAAGNGVVLTKREREMQWGGM